MSTPRPPYRSTLAAARRAALSRTFRVAAIALLVLLAAGSAAAKETVTQEIDKTFRLQPGGEVVLENVNGHIHVEGWDRDRVELRVVKKVKAPNRADAERAMRELEVTIDSTPERLHVQTKKPDSWDGLSGWLRNARVEYQASYDLKVPRHVLLRARTVNGGVQLTRLNGEVSARTTNGAIALDEVAGQIEASTTNGSVQVEEARGSVSASTTNGRIRVALNQVTPDARMDFRTTNGSVTVALPRDVRTHLKARTTNGSISTDFDVPVERSRSRRTSIDAAINGGGEGMLEVRTTNGGISIEEI